MDNIEVKTALPKELVTNLLEFKKERTYTQSLEFPRVNDTLPPLQNITAGVSSLPTLQSSLHSLMCGNAELQTDLSHFRQYHEDNEVGDPALWQELFTNVSGSSGLGVALEVNQK